MWRSISPRPRHSESPAPTPARPAVRPSVAGRRDSHTGRVVRKCAGRSLSVVACCCTARRTLGAGEAQTGLVERTRGGGPLGQDHNLIIIDTPHPANPSEHEMRDCGGPSTRLSLQGSVDSVTDSGSSYWLASDIGHRRLCTSRSWQPSAPCASGAVASASRHLLLQIRKEADCVILRV